MTSVSTGPPNSQTGPKYDQHPDFTRPRLVMDPRAEERIAGHLRFLYGDAAAAETLPEIVRLIKVHHAHKSAATLEVEKTFDPAQRFTERDMGLIVYGDMIRDEGRPPLAALADLLSEIGRRGTFNIVHILPFFPYSSDRGFSVTDFMSVDPRLGSWHDIEQMADSFRLMFDAVLNHVSAESTAFREMLAGAPGFKDLAVAFRSPDELTPEQRRLLRRPRTSDILTMFHALDGPIWVWTTFSPDQVDLNYRNPRVLLLVIEALLMYVRRGADLLRLDAITYLWDEPGTTGASLEQTHAVVRLLREVLNVAAPHVALVTESNVPHEENISYFGNGHDEAQAVYNFALPPLVLHAFYRGDATALSAWAERLEYPSPAVTYLNFLDSHDGIGLSGVTGILPPEETSFLIDQARQHGAFISYRSDGEGRQVPYELNTTWYSALNLDNSRDETRAFQVKRFVASRSIALALAGVPFIYLHGLIGSRSDVQLALRTRTKRDVNRAAVDPEFLRQSLTDRSSKISLIRDSLGRLLQARVRQKAFHPNGQQSILRLDRRLFAIARTSPDASQHLLAVTNVSRETCQVDVPVKLAGVAERNWYDLVSGRGWGAQDGNLSLSLGPYDVLWLTPFAEIEQQIASA